MNLTYDKDQEEAHYHFALAEIVYYITQNGIDKVMVDVYDLLANECNTKVKQVEMEYHTHED
jgi:hypothetical protein